MSKRFLSLAAQFESTFNTPDRMETLNSDRIGRVQVGGVRCHLLKATVDEFAGSVGLAETEMGMSEVIEQEGIVRTFIQIQVQQTNVSPQLGIPDFVVGVTGVIDDDIGPNDLCATG